VALAGQRPATTFQYARIYPFDGTSH
jgi:hypothetical protein